MGQKQVWVGNLGSKGTSQYADSIRKGIEMAKKEPEKQPEKPKLEYVEEKLLSLEWPFEDEEDPDWSWCKQYATFSHRDACEFIIHIGKAEDEHWDFILDQMKTYGCSKEFMDAYIAAKDAGAVRLLVWC